MYGFIGNGAHKSSLLKKGYLTEQQWTKKESSSNLAPASPRSTTKDNLTQLRELSELKEKGFLTDEEFSLQKAKILNA